ncbi:MAG: FAD-dependent oxidoreductase [Bacteroidales bacterium]|nr:FAD-dependent oxidoreductase [Bacteroidales bacterium]
MTNQYDKIIIGAGLYGLYSALLCGKKGENVIVLEYDSEAFKRATYINQARVHMGYHYPRSYSTAIKSAHYFDRFNQDYGFCILSKFDKIYATSSTFSWTNAQQFTNFCHAANIKCDQIPVDKYFNPGMCDGAFQTEEYTFDACLLRDHFLKEIKEYPNVEIKLGCNIDAIRKADGHYELRLKDGTSFRSEFVLNATYASVNQIHDNLGFEKFKIKYELCEIILCTVNENLKNIGLTIMDGPFFSIMPFGKTGLHSLTSVTFTPHLTSKEALPTYSCQAKSNGYCTPQQLGNCNDCQAKPESAWPYMSYLAKKYLKEEYGFQYHSSLFSIKPILLASEIDDSRPTVIRQFSSKPTFVSVLSGKINTVYDLDKILSGDGKNL